MFKNRVIVSFEGKCEMNCKHCFALEQERKYKINDVQAVVQSLQDREFDIIYVSHNKENFIDAESGVQLCKQLYAKYNKDICVTSRCILVSDMFNEIVLLNEKMKENGKQIYWCESIPALETASITEDLSKVPTPRERIEFLEKLKKNNIRSILSVRPLFPNIVISNNEIRELIQMASGKVDAVITGGLATTEEIDKRLSLNQTGWKYLENNESEYLLGAIGDKARFVDVSAEIAHLRQCCDMYGIAFFEHSLQAINYLANI